MLPRILTAFVGLPVLFWAVFHGTAVPFTILAAAATLIGAWEFFRLAVLAGYQPAWKTGTLFSLALLFAAGVPEEGGLASPAGWVLALGLLCAFGVAMLRQHDLQRTAATVGITMLGILYLGFLMAFPLRLKWAHAADAVSGEVAKDFLFLIFVLAFSCDTCAYFAGRTLGRHKLHAVISPKKTWEGFAGGVAGSALGMVAGKYTFFQHLTWWDIALLAPVAAVVAHLGDLFESMLKRGAHAKDSGAFMPGHGGMLDRLDSLLFMGPLVFFYWQYLWPYVGGRFT